jgi:hypothetical protein
VRGWEKQLGAGPVTHAAGVFERRFRSSSDAAGGRPYDAQFSLNSP